MSKFVDNGFVATSDVHFSTSTLDVAYKVLEQALQLSIINKLPLYIGGDLNDSKAIIRSETIKMISELFLKYDSVEKFVLIGNHDRNHEKNSHDHSLEFMKLIPKTTVIDQATFIGNGWYAIPYCNSGKQFMEAINEARSQGLKKILCHQGFWGAKMGHYVSDHTSVHPDELADFDIVLTGHYHEHQKVGKKQNVMYFGSPYTVSFAEAGDSKVIWKIEDLEGKIKATPFPTEVRKHIQIEFENAIGELPKLRKDDLLKVVVKGEKAFVASIQKKDIQEKTGCDNVVLVPKISKQSSIRMDINSSMTPLDVITSYVSKANTDLNKEKLMDYFKTVIA